MKRQPTEWRKYFRIVYPERGLYLEYIKNSHNTTLTANHSIQKQEKLLNRHPPKAGAQAPASPREDAQQPQPAGRRKPKPQPQRDHAIDTGRRESESWVATSDGEVGRNQNLTLCWWARKTAQPLGKTVRQVLKGLNRVTL